MHLPEFPAELAAKLLPYQVTPSRQIVRALQCGPAEWGYAGAADLSDVGIGKSYIDSAAALMTGRKPIVLCPSVGTNGWRRVFDHFGRDPHFIGTYEAVRGGWRKEIGDFGTDGYFAWKNASDIVIILDEAHIVKGMESMTTATVGGAIKQGIPIIAASATLATSPLEMRIAGRVTGLHKGGRDFKEWLLRNGCRFLEAEQRWTFDKRRRDVLDNINRILIPERGCRVRKGEAASSGGTAIRILPLDCPEAATIEKMWEEHLDKIEAMKDRRFDRDIITKTDRAGKMKLWKASELALVPIVAQRVKACLDQGKSVVVFFSFTAARVAMGKLLRRKEGFFGGQTPAQRKKIEADFQANRIHVLLCNIGAAGASVSLHDIHGQRPRETFIFPTNNAVKFGQAPGRVDRAGGQSHSDQWIPCIRGGYSERMVKQTMSKLRNLSILNDGDDQQRLAV